MKLNTMLVSGSHCNFFFVNMLFVEIPCTAILAVYGTAIGLGRDAGYSQNVGGSVGLHIDSNTIFFLSWIGGIIFPLMLTASLNFVVVDALLMLTALLTFVVVDARLCQ